MPKSEAYKEAHFNLCIELMILLNCAARFRVISLC